MRAEPGWKINIVGHDVKPASWYLANEKNVRIHPRAQSAQTEGSLDELGWVKSVTVNKRTSSAWGPQDRGVETLLDGHDRIKLALRRGDDTPVPLEYVDLDPVGEDKFLLWVDEIVSGAGKDKNKLGLLLRDTKPADAALQQLLSDMAAKEGITPPVGLDKQGRVDQKAKVECPACGTIFETNG
jgi:hypothetical protein